MLLWLAAAFIGAAKLGVKFGHPVVWWLAIPLTLLPQFLMHEPTFGPDTSDELIPHPVVLFYYALFFVVGAMLYQRGVRMRREWAFALIPALLVAFPVGIVTLGEDLPDAARAVSHVMQTAYAWLMCFGMIGLFKLVASKERYWVRYMSDASYWLYLWHLPLVAASQLLVRGWPINVHLKFRAHLRRGRRDTPGRLPARRALHVGRNDAERPPLPARRGVCVGLTARTSYTLTLVEPWPRPSIRADEASSLLGVNGLSERQP